MRGDECKMKVDAEGLGRAAKVMLGGSELRASDDRQASRCLQLDRACVEEG